MELMVVITVMGVLVAMAAPSYHRSIERARADVAVGHLRSLWLAQRIWRLDRSSYADEATLTAEGLLEPAMLTAVVPYDYQVTSADAASFSARATRGGSPSWTGWFEIDESGAVDGVISHDGIPVITPSYQFSEH